MAKGSGNTRSKGPSANPQLKGAGNTKKQTSHEKEMNYADSVDHIMNLTGVDEGEADNMYWAIGDWSESMYKEIRAASRGESQNKYDLLRADRLERFIELSPKWNGGTTYRGLDIPDSVISQFKVGQTFDPLGIASWSTSRDTAEAFSGLGRKFVIRCEKPQNGTSIKFASYCPSENEVMTSGRCQYKITKITNEMTRGMPITIVDVEPIANKKK